MLRGSSPGCRPPAHARTASSDEWTPVFVGVLGRGLPERRLGASRLRAWRARSSTI